MTAPTPIASSEADLAPAQSTGRTVISRGVSSAPNSPPGSQGSAAFFGEAR